MMRPPRRLRNTASTGVSVAAARVRAERLAILGQRNGVWRCRTIFNCADACPRGIPVTDLIEQVKRAIVYGNDTKVE